jgi:GDP-D-mannose 3',5'-epimerase
LVTGGLGFVGSHLSNYLKEKGYYVKVADCRSLEGCYLSLKADKVFPFTDLRRKKNTSKVTANVDWVFNLAANMGGIGYITKIGADIMRDNALININVLEACRHNNVEKVFFSSSACVYPTCRQTSSEVKPLREEDAFPAEPDLSYGWEKLFAEKLMEAYENDYGVKTRIARFYNVYGPYGSYKGGREKAPAALCRKVARARNNGVINIWGDGKQTRSFLYVDDAVEGVLSLMKSDYSKPLNIGSDRLISIDALADMIISISGKRLRKRYDPNAPQGVRGRNADLSRTRMILGWYPKIDYSEGLTRTYRWIEEKVRKEKADTAL